MKSWKAELALLADHSQWLKWPGQAGGSEDGGIDGGGNLTHFMHKNTSSLSAGWLKPE